jgi:squalene synthase HpnC
MKTELAKAYAYCQNLAKSHYENFPVASLLLPKRLRRPISVIYAFARTADDFADEGNGTPAERLAKLESYRQALQAISANQYLGDDPIFIALADVIQQHQLPQQLFDDLIKAFQQDVAQQRYQDLHEVMLYCRYSANPVGRLILLLHGQATEHQLQQSDAICSALQLINFYQDIEQDLTEMNRVYLPQDQLNAHAITEADLLITDTTRLAPLLRGLYHHTATLMQQGVPLGVSVNGRLGWEIRAMILGGVASLRLLQQQQDHQLLLRPRLKKSQLMSIMFASICPWIYQRTTSRWLSEITHTS